MATRVGVELDVQGQGTFVRKVGQGEQALKGLGATADQTGTAMRGGARDADVLDRGLRDIDGGAREAESGLDGLKLGVLALGAAVAGAGVGALGSTFDAIGASGRLAAQLDLDPAEREEAGRIAGSLYGNAYGESITNATDGVGAVMSTLDTDDVERATQRALVLADTFGIDVAEGVSAAGLAMSSGLATDSDHAMDLIMAGMGAMPAHLRDELLEANHEYGQFFSQLGLTGEQAFGMLAQAAQDKGMYGIDKTGDALKELTIRATDMSAASVAAYESAGLSAEDMSARFLAGGATSAGAFDDLVGGLLAMEDPVAQANAAIALFGTPLEDLSVQEIPSFLAGLQSTENALDNVTGAVDRADHATDGAMKNITTFKRSAEMAVTGVLGGTVIPYLEQLSQDAAPAIASIRADLSTIFGAVSGAFGDAGIDLSSIPVDLLTGVATAIGAAADNADVLAAAAPALTAGMIALGAGFAIAAGGPLLIAAGLATLTAGIIYLRETSEGFRAGFDAFFVGLQIAALAIGGALVLGAQLLVNTVSILVEGALMALTPFAMISDALFGTSFTSTLDGAVSDVRGFREQTNAELDSIQEEIAVNLDTTLAEQRLRNLTEDSQALQRALDAAGVAGRVAGSGAQTSFRPDGGGGQIPVGSGAAAGPSTPPASAAPAAPSAPSAPAPPRRTPGEPSAEDRRVRSGMSVVNNIYQLPGESSEELADRIADRLDWREAAHAGLR